MKFVLAKVNTLLDMIRLLQDELLIVELLKNLGLRDSLSELVEVMRWVKFMKLVLPVYDRLCWEFLSSLRVKWSNPFQNQPVHIIF